MKADFEHWLSAQFADTGPFTIFIVLVDIRDEEVVLLKSSYAHMIGDVMAWSDMRALLDRIALPTLIVHGGRSELYGDETAGHLVAALPDARAVRFGGSGHAPHLEEPSLFNQILRDFAARLSRGGPIQPIES